MGQYGAFGYVRNHGWSYRQVLQHFYGNTTVGSSDPNLPVDVWLKGRDNRPLMVYSALPMRVGGVLVEGTALVQAEQGQWVLRAAPRGANNCLQNWGAPVAVGPTSSPVSIELTSDPGEDIWKMLGICDSTGIRHYRGALRLLTSTTSRVVNRVAVDAYIRGVVPRESPSGWPLDALKSQAVAARSYALSEGGESGKRFTWAKTCDDQQCQVYSGAGFNGDRLEVPSTDAAVASTAGEVRRFGDGQLARTEFSSSTGGYTNGTPVCSICSFPAVPDEGDVTSSRHDWTTEIAYSSIESKYGIGTFRDIAVTRRNGLGDGGGRALDVVVSGSLRTVTVSGDDFRSAFGLFSDWFFLENGLTWHVRHSASAGSADLTISYGNRGDVPVPGDWNGDGRSGVGTFLNGVWYLRDAQTPGQPEVAFRYGNPGDHPVVGDWNGDGHDSVGTFRDGVWYLRNSATPGPAEIVIRYGNPGDVTVVGDWNGDGADSVGTWLAGWWYLRDSLSTGPADVAFRYGNQGDTPLPGDWNVDQVSTAGTVLSGTWYLRNAPRSGGSADVPVFNYGVASDQYLAADFDGDGSDGPVVIR